MHLVSYGNKPWSLEPACQIPSPTSQFNKQIKEWGLGTVMPLVQNPNEGREKIQCVWCWIPGSSKDSWVGGRHTVFGVNQWGDIWQKILVKDKLSTFWNRMPRTVKRKLGQFSSEMKIKTKKKKKIKQTNNIHQGMGRWVSGVNYWLLLQRTQGGSPAPTGWLAKHSWLQFQGVWCFPPSSAGTKLTHGMLTPVSR